MKKEVLSKGISTLGRQFTEKVFDAEMIWEYTKDLTDEQFNIAIKRIMTEKTSINRSDNVIAIIRQEALKPALLEAGDAWGVVVRAISSLGSYNTPVFKDKVIGRAVECMGWRNLCLSENQTVDRAHFLKIYEQLKSRVEKDSVSLDKDVKELVNKTARALK